MTSSTFLMTCAAALSQKLSFNKGRSGFQHLRGEILSKRLVLSIARHPLAAISLCSIELPVKLVGNALASLSAGIGCDSKVFNPTCNSRPELESLGERRLLISEQRYPPVIPIAENKHLAISRSATEQLCTLKY